MNNDNRTVSYTHLDVYKRQAYGFMLMTDLYGEMPYKSSEAEAGVTPTYNDGKTIYLGCVADLDTAIEMFQKEQGLSLIHISDVEVRAMLLYLTDNFLRARTTVGSEAIHTDAVGFQ